MSETYTITAEWSGPMSPAGNYTREQHLEHTRSQKRVAAIRELGMIRFSDGTALYFRVETGKHGKPFSRYADLIRSCLHYKVTSVDALYKAEEQAKKEQHQ